MGKTLKQVLAWIAIGLLLCLYAVSLISAITSDANSQSWFMASLYATFIVPLWIYFLQYMYKKSHPEGSVSRREYKKMVKKMREENESAEDKPAEDESAEDGGLDNRD